MQKNRNLARWVSVAIIVSFIAAVGAYAIENTSITGKVIRAESGSILIQTPDKQQYVVLGKNLSNMVGKTVEATGTVLENTREKSIMVVKVNEVKK